jgi:hypothetical protein
VRSAYLAYDIVGLMPTFYLEPKDGYTSDRSWMTSTLKEGFWVVALDETHARIIATHATVIAADFRHAEKMAYPLGAIRD